MKSTECIGKTVNGYTVLEFKSKVGLLAKHSCGNSRKFRGPKEFLTNRQRCIKCQQTTKTPVENIFHIYQKNAKKRNILFSLSVEEFNFLIGEKCFYCDAEPSILEKGRWKDEQWHEEFARNGIDRLNATEDYNSSNCVPCCFRCNQLKGNLELDEFVRLLRAIYKNLFVPKHNGLNKK